MSQSLAVRPAQDTVTVARVREIVEQFAARDRSGEILTAVRHIPAREAKLAPMPEWVTWPQERRRPIPRPAKNATRNDSACLLPPETRLVDSPTFVGPASPASPYSSRRGTIRSHAGYKRNQA